MNDSTFEKLRTRLYSDNWEESLEAADKLSGMENEESTEILLEALKSDNNFHRNAAALGLRDFPKQEILPRIFQRINELGLEEEVGTIVYALEAYDCSKYLLEVAKLHLLGNAEVEMSTRTILEEQTFKIKKEELDRVEEVLLTSGFPIQELKLEIE